MPEESYKHMYFKRLVVTILKELGREGMKIRHIQEEKKETTEKYIEKIKHFIELNIINYDEGEMHGCHNIPYVFYLMWAEDSLQSKDILLNLDGDVRIYYDKHIQFSNSQSNFVVIKIESNYSFYNHHRRSNNPVNLSFNGSLFVIGVKRSTIEKYPRLMFQYKYEEIVEKTKYNIYDVGCKYKRQQFGIEIGNCNHKHRNRVLILDYSYLNNNTLTSIKNRIQKFLIKHSKVT